MAERKRKSLGARATTISWAASLFFAIGYLLTTWSLHWAERGFDPRLAIIVAAMAVIPFGSRAPSTLRGVLRGAGLGAMAGLGIAAAAGHGQIDWRVAVPYLIATMVLCAAAAALFAFLRQRRLQRAEQEWDQVKQD